MGVFLAAPLMPDEFALPHEELADLIAETVHQTLASRRPVSSDELHIVSCAFT